MKFGLNVEWVYYIQLMQLYTESIDNGDMRYRVLQSYHLVPDATFASTLVAILCTLAWTFLSV